MTYCTDIDYIYKNYKLKFHYIDYISKGDSSSCTYMLLNNKKVYKTSDRQSVCIREFLDFVKLPRETIEKTFD